jgi:hypothetical protein
MIMDANIAISVIPFYPLQGQLRSSWIAPVNILSREKQIAVISALTEGCSIRATERLTGIHRDSSRDTTPLAYRSAAQDQHVICRARQPHGQDAATALYQVDECL